MLLHKEQFFKAVSGTVFIPINFVIRSC
jgi:hypothetical protein